MFESLLDPNTDNSALPTVCLNYVGRAILRRIRRLFPALAVMTLVFLLHAIGSFVEVRGDSVPKARISPQQVRSIPLSVSDRINLACARHWHKQIRRYGVPVA